MKNNLLNKVISLAVVASTIAPLNSCTLNYTGTPTPTMQLSISPEVLNGLKDHVINQVNGIQSPSELIKLENDIFGNPTVQAIEKLVKPNPSFVDFDSKQVQLFNLKTNRFSSIYSYSDSNQKSITINNVYNFTLKDKKFVTISNVQTPVNLKFNIEKQILSLVGCDVFDHIIVTTKQGEKIALTIKNKETELPKNINDIQRIDCDFFRTNIWSIVSQN